MEEREHQLRVDQEQNRKLDQLKGDVEAEKERLADLSRTGQLRELSHMKEVSFQQRELHRVQQQVKQKEQEMEYATMREE